MKLPKMKKLRKPNSSGDTIVEVLIALAIAAFALGISYATAARSLDQGISAREHNEALNVLENQLVDLRLRFQHTSAATFESTYGYSSPDHHYCLNDDSTGPNDTLNPWTPIINGNITVNSALGTPDYNAKCSIQRYSQGSAEGAIYWVDIATSPSSASKSPTLYHVTVRWARLGGGTSQASLFYKLDGSTAGVLAAANQNTNILPSCPLPAPNPISEDDTLGLFALDSQVTDHHMQLYQYPVAWQPNPACTYSVQVQAKIRTLPSPPQPHQQMYIEFCRDISTDCDGSQARANSYTMDISKAGVYRSPITTDIAEPAKNSNDPAFSIPPFAAGTSINYLLIKHCAILNAICRAQRNDIAGYVITVVGT